VDDTSDIEKYWRRTLDGFTAPTPLPALHPVAAEGKSGSFREQRSTIEAETTTALRALVERQSISLESVLHGAWALLLGRCTASADVLFGAAVSAQATTDLTPLRVRLPGSEPVQNWLVQLEDQRQQLGQLERVELNQIQDWSSMPQGAPLFESCLTIEAAKPSASAARSKAPAPLIVRVKPEEGQLHVRMIYRDDRISASDVQWLMQRFKAALVYIATHPGHTLEQVSLTKFLPDSPVVELRSGGAGAPLFLAPGLGGNALTYAALSRHLGDDRPIFVFQAPLAQEGQRFQHRMQELARFYLETLRAVQPEGPYLLGGWSMGGFVAYEMAQQLRKEGQEVALLALIDAVPPRKDEVEEKDRVQLLIQLARQHGLKIGPKRLEKLSGRRQLLYVLRKLKKASLVPADMPTKSLLQKLRQYKAHTIAARSYVPTPYPGKVTLFRPLESANDKRHELLLGWDRLAQVELHKVPGSHFSVVKEPHVRTLARELRECLPNLQARTIR